MRDELLTTVLAVWGALLSTAAIAWNIGRDVTDRAQLRLTCYFARLVGGPGPPDERVKLVFNVTNTGRRPAVISNIGGALQKPTEFVINCRGSLPRNLQPGEYFLEYIDDLADFQQVTALWAIDSLSKRWKVPRRQMRRLIREARENRYGRAAG